MPKLKLLIVLLLVAPSSVLGLGALAPAAAHAGQTQESIFEDENLLIYSNVRTVDRTLATLRSLGVERVRVIVNWAAIAPRPKSRTRPSNFDATNPDDYPAGVWYPYDRLDVLAARHGMSVYFDISAPGPLWAMASGSPTTRAANHWEPSAAEFAEFVYALGARYDGKHGGWLGNALPRVDYWSVWNEPNQPGWLAPQWRSVGGKQVPYSPVLYRQYVNAAFLALAYSGHISSGATFLIGELAPEGFTSPGFYTAMTPMPFLRDLYCVGSNYQPLRGSAASDLGCPTSGSTTDFVNANLGLFYATGFAHHPYFFFHPPGYRTSDADFVPLANLSRLERGLDDIFRSYGVSHQLPIYITEYGYQTKPPDPYQSVTPAQQAAYLNQADYMAWRDSRVRSVAQFLLRDDKPDRHFRPSQFGYWDTFQTGLEYQNGRAKPALQAYQMPVWVPSPRVSRGGSMLVWGQLRPAALELASSSRPTERARVQWRGSHGGWRTLATVSVTSQQAYFTTRVRPPGSGQLRIAWSPSRHKQLTSRSVSVTIR